MPHVLLPPHRTASRTHGRTTCETHTREPSGTPQCAGDACSFQVRIQLRMNQRQVSTMTLIMQFRHGARELVLSTWCVKHSGCTWHLVPVVSRQIIV